MNQLLSLHVVCLLVAGATLEPAPGRIPKVYNALITSNQNLEPSKAYPVYQPVLHDAAFAFPFQPAVFYGGDFPLGHGLIPPSAIRPKEVTPEPSVASPAEANSPSTENTPSRPESGPTLEDGKSTTASPLPPNTQSPIPLNEFGLPPHVLPLGRLDPAFDGFTQVGPFTYSYPGLRFYDPYDPFSLNPYANLPPLYRPFGNVLSQSAPVPVAKEAPAASAPIPTEQSLSEQNPPSEPSDLNLLNYSSKDPAIPNVPPPPLPQDGLKSDKSE